MERMIAAILENQVAAARRLLRQDTQLARAQFAAARLFETGVLHWLYVGDTLLHLAAAGHRAAIAKLLLDAGALVNAAANHRGGQPLHYAADGYVVSPAWDADAQVATLRCLLEHGADLHAQDRNGATALHRAVRTRCAAAVQCLLNAGGDPTQPNRAGSTPFHLAVQSTGRGGSGAPSALEAQRQIIQLFRARGVSMDLKDGKGHTVRQCARSTAVRALLDD